MKSNLVKSIFAMAVVLCMTSCYSLSYTVGKGASTGVVHQGKNHYLLEGLVALKTTTPAELAGGAKDYEVTVEHTFIDGVVRFLTSGLYTPSTTTVRK
jgi:hypothetical protein